MTPVFMPPLEVLQRNAEHFEGAARGEFVVQVCDRCGACHLPAARACGSCRSRSLSWRAIRPVGTVRAWCRFHRPYIPAFRLAPPYVVVLVDMDDGLAVYSTLAGAGRTGAVPRVGSRVQATFDAIGADLSIPTFRITGDSP